MKDELDRLPVDARLDLEARKLVPEQNGRLLDIDATLGAIEEALGRGESKVKVVFEERRPKRVAAELGAVAFDDILGYFETHYDRSAHFQARSYNLRLAASKLDGQVLLPGEVFDFNDTVGPRDETNGYKVAKVIAEGELVDGIGGGTCQISGTLHGAAFFAGLDIVERYPHTRPSGYIKMGMDATVVYPTINFRIRNSFPFPIVLHETVKNGVVRAEILGQKRTRTVTLIRRIDAALPFEEVERPDKDLPNGVRVLGQRGVPGFKLRRYRIIREGDNAVRERWDDTYPPTSQIVRVGAGDISKEQHEAAARRPAPGVRGRRAARHEPGSEARRRRLGRGRKEGRRHRRPWRSDARITRTGKIWNGGLDGGGRNALLAFWAKQGRGTGNRPEPGVQAAEAKREKGQRMKIRSAGLTQTETCAKTPAPRAVGGFAHVLPERYRLAGALEKHEHHRTCR